MNNIGFIGEYNNSYLYYKENNKINNLEILTNSKEKIGIIEYSNLLEENDSKQSIIKILSNKLFLNRIYFIFSLFLNEKLTNLKVSLFDLESKKNHQIFIPEENIKKIIKVIPTKDFFTVLEQNKFLFFGGFNISEENKISKSCISFDITTYLFEKIKFHEFSLIPRFKGGCTSQNGIIYILGGFTSLANPEKNICPHVQFCKYFEEKMHKFNFAKIEGEKPLLMIDNNIFIIDDRYVVSFSGFNYLKLWIMDTNNNIGHNYEIDKENKNENNIFYFLIKCKINKNIQLEIGKINYINETFDIINKEINIIT